jgi:hypothetical protein
MFSCPRCSDRFEANAVPSALVCPRCRDDDGVFSPLTFWLFDSPVVRTQPARTSEPRRGRYWAPESKSA